MCVLTTNLASSTCISTNTCAACLCAQMEAATAKRIWEVMHADRAKRNWHIMKTMLMAIGMFKLAGLNRQRAKELSAAEVKRGLRRNRSGAGQSHVIPTMSFYSPKAQGEGGAGGNGANSYGPFCDQVICDSSVM
jgi:hypothetical protein